MQETTDINDTMEELVPSMDGTRTLRLDRQELKEGWAEKDRMPRYLLTLKMGAKTDLGRVRDNNEDKFDFYEPEDPAVLATKGCFYGVADGMGGHSAGQIACELALKTIIQSYYANPSPDIESSLQYAIGQANALIYDTARIIPERSGMGTTLTAAILCEDRVTIAQIGDSRAYRIRDGLIEQMTNDHSWVAEQVREGTMTLAEAQSSPFRNIITRSIGTAATIEPDITTHTVQADDFYILCSDGLTGHLDQSEIKEIVMEYSPSVAALRMVDQANDRGGRDNITALVLSIRSLTALAESDPASSLPQEGTGSRKSEKRGWGLRR
jgi:serine/threonine protein phosphatase PrpC